MTRNARSSASATAGKSSAQTRFEGWRRIEPLEETARATTRATRTIEPAHASVEFSLDYMGLSTHRTGVRALEGSLEFDAAWPAASSVNAAIPVASVDVTSRPMDLDLLGGKDHSTINFKSTNSVLEELFEVPPTRSLKHQQKRSGGPNGIPPKVAQSLRFEIHGVAGTQAHGH